MTKLKKLPASGGSYTVDAKGNPKLAQQPTKPTPLRKPDQVKPDRATKKEG